MGFHGFFPFRVLLHSLPFLGQGLFPWPPHTHTVLFFYYFFSFLDGRITKTKFFQYDHLCLY
ncbi:hypothetical protein NC653_015925 [Populus alba x Populus x berolinensis]|uniref:Uncharacterized protein n=1 Tax=Populus alba x Populus x berolinensis TaxID=444605 RepID=A0AAD6QLZ7_9ROSI|nr:hypothetical protein NC653_015925 [Populus alba x Populus x berolinensis]